MEAIALVFSLISIALVVLLALIVGRRFDKIAEIFILTTGILEKQKALIEENHKDVIEKLRCSNVSRGKSVAAVLKQMDYEVVECDPTGMPYVVKDMLAKKIVKATNPKK